MESTGFSSNLGKQFSENEEESNSRYNEVNEIGKTVILAKARNEDRLQWVKD